MSEKLLSVVVPVHNEVDGIKSFVNDCLLPVLDGLKYKYELLLVNDGSTDGTLEVLRDLAEKKSRMRVISLSRNFGKESALSAGLAYAEGVAAIMLDADGQQPPDIIPDFVAKWEEGAMIVTGVRSKFTKHGLIQKMGSKMFYALFRLAGEKNVVSGATDFRLLDREVIDEYNKFSEHNRIARGLIDWLGYKQEYIEYVYGARNAGRPSYNMKKLFKLAIDSFVAMTTVPLAIFGYLGFALSVLSFLVGTFCLVEQHLLGDPMGLCWSGFVQLSILLVFIAGLVICSQAVLGLYISHIHAETQNRPLFVVDIRNSVGIKRR